MQRTESKIYLRSKNVGQIIISVSIATVEWSFQSSIRIKT